MHVLVDKCVFINHHHETPLPIVPRFSSFLGWKKEGVLCFVMHPAIECCLCHPLVWINRSMYTFWTAFSRFLD